MAERPVDVSVAVIAEFPTVVPVMDVRPDALDIVTFELEEAQLTEAVISWDVPSLYTPIAEIGITFATETCGDGGVMLIAVGRAGAQTPL